MILNFFKRLFERLFKKPQEKKEEQVGCDCHMVKHYFKRLNRVGGYAYRCTKCDNVNYR